MIFNSKKELLMYLKYIIELGYGSQGITYHDKKLNKAINTFEKVDEAFILVSGDISQSGTKEQFDIFKSIIGRIYKNR